jgi:hypothetical protein
VITVSLSFFPDGHPKAASRVATVTIENVTGDGPVADYAVRLLYGHAKEERAVVRVDGFERRRGALELVGEAFGALASRLNGKVPL